MTSAQGEQPVVALDEFAPYFSDYEVSAREESGDDAVVVGPVVDFGLDSEPDDDVVEDDEQPVVADVDDASTAPPVFPSSAAEKYYSSKEVAQFFDKSTQWLYWGYREEDANGNPITPVFVYPDGSLIEPIRIGKGQRRRYTLPIIREMALACYRRGNLKEPQLRRVLAKIKTEEKKRLVPAV